MKIRFAVPAALLASLISMPLRAQWSVGASTGPFAFGEFAERSVRAAAGGGTGNVSHVKLTAKVRPGIAIDVQRDFSARFAVGLEGTVTSSPLAVKSGSNSVGIDAGRLDVSTFTLPLIFRINPRGTFRFHVSAAPAYALYRIRNRVAPGAAIVPYRGTRGRFGAAAAGGVDWWFSDRFAVGGEVNYIRTSSPFAKTDFIAPDLMHIPQPQNVHTTVGLRWRF